MSPVRVRRLLRRLGALVVLLGVFSVELVRSNLLVAREVLSPGHRMSAAILAVPVRSRTDLEVTLFAGLLALTPGTLPLEERDGELFLHVLHAPSPEEFRRHTLALEDRLLAVLR